MERPTATLVRAMPFFYGWWVVIASAAIVLVTTGTFYYGFSTLIGPLGDEFGWSRALISGAFSVALVASGLAGPVAGHLADRLGAPRLLLVGVLLMGGGFVLLGLIQAAWALYVVIATVAIGMSVAGPLVCYIAIAHWFVKKRGWALALMSCGVGASGVMVVVLAALISLLGWRSAVVMIGIFQLAVCIPLALTVRHRPEDVGLLPDGERQASGQSSSGPAVASLRAESAVGRKVEDVGLTMRQALGTRSFWLLTCGGALAGLGSTAIIAHMVPFLSESAGLTEQGAALIAMGIPFGSLVGRVSFGWLADHVAKRQLVMVAYVLQGAGILIFATTSSPWQAAVFLVVFALGWGGAIPVLPALAADYFGLRAFGGIQGLMWAIATLGAFSGPVSAGVVYDMMDSYRPAFLLMTLTTMAAVPAILMIGRPPSWTREADAAPEA